MFTMNCKDSTRKMEHFVMRSMSRRLTCNGQRVDDGGDDHVRQGEVCDESAPGVVVGRLRSMLLPVAKVLDDDRHDDHQVAESSDDRSDPEHCDVERSKHRLPTVQRSRCCRDLGTVPFSHVHEWKLHRRRLLRALTVRVYRLSTVYLTGQADYWTATDVQLINYKSAHQHYEARLALPSTQSDNISQYSFTDTASTQLSQFWIGLIRRLVRNWSSVSTTANWSNAETSQHRTLIGRDDIAHAQATADDAAAAAAAATAISQIWTSV